MALNYVTLYYTILNGFNNTMHIVTIQQLCPIVFEHKLGTRNVLHFNHSVSLSLFKFAVILTFVNHQNQCHDSCAVRSEECFWQREGVQVLLSIG